MVNPQGHFLVFSFKQVTVMHSLAETDNTVTINVQTLPCFFPTGVPLFSFLQVQHVFLLLSNSPIHVHTSSVVGKLPYLFLVGKTPAHAASLKVESLFVLLPYKEKVVAGLGKWAHAKLNDFNLFSLLMCVCMHVCQCVCVRMCVEVFSSFITLF